MIMGKRLKDAFFDPSSSSLHWVHTAAELVEAVEVTLAIVASGASGTTGIAGTVAHWLHRLESIGTTASEIGGVAEASLIFTPIALGGAAMVAEFAALGMGYADAAEEIAEENTARGYCLGVVMGAMLEHASMVERFLMKRPPKYDAFPAGGKVAQDHFNAALLRGYAEGLELTSAQRPVLWAELRKNGGMIPTGNGKPDEGFYAEAAGRFRRLHIK
jgi:hypothetical protein